MGRSRGTNKGRSLDEFIRCRINYIIALLLKLKKAILQNDISMFRQLLLPVSIIYAYCILSQKLKNFFKENVFAA